MWQYTNRGLGMVWAPQVRFNCRPEITIVTLTV
jgi:predicted MPP superfamily phosphohydrolase